MRWMWIDKFTEFQSGSHATSVKNVSLAEEHLHDHYPGFPVMPGSLIIEGMAQTGGILLGSTNDFKHVVILGKIPKMTFHSWVVPGDTLTYTAKLVDVRPEGGMTEVSAKVGDRLVADGEIFFAHVDQSVNGPSGAIIDQKNFVFSMRLMGVMNVGKAGDGSPAAAESAS